MLTSEYPICTPNTAPAICAASNTKFVANPMATPSTNSRATTPGHCMSVTMPTCAEYTGYSTAVMRMTRITLVRGGIAPFPKNGANNIRPEIRIAITSGPVNNSVSESSIGLSHVRMKVGKQFHGVLTNLPPHPRHHEECSRRHRHEPRHGGERGFLKRSQNLSDVHQQTHRNRKRQNRRRQQQHFEQCVTANIFASISETRRDRETPSKLGE